MKNIPERSESREGELGTKTSETVLCTEISEANQRLFMESYGQERTAGVLQRALSYGEKGTRANLTAGQEQHFGSAFNNDLNKRTEVSFDASVAQAIKLGKSDEVKLELKTRDWFQSQDKMDSPTYLRGLAGLAGALGRFRLEEGSRLDLTSHQDTKERILKGQDYDFGGEATIWLRTSAGALKDAQAQVAKGQDAESIDYTQQLKALQLKAEQTLDRIYGTHNIPRIFEELKHQAEVNSGDMNQALVRLKNQNDQMHSGDVRYVAKSSRDLAIGYIAQSVNMAEKNNHEESRIMRQAAMDYLGKSEKLDPAAPDNKAITDLYLDLEKKGRFR